MKTTAQRQRQKNTTIAPPRQPAKRRYHLADDAECVFEYEAPEWLIGG